MQNLLIYAPDIYRRGIWDPLSVLSAVGQDRPSLLMHPEYAFLDFDKSIMSIRQDLIIAFLPGL